MDPGSFSPLDWVIYQDEALLVINKPAGIPTLPDGYHPEVAHLKSVLTPFFGDLWIVHRLDRDTSGILVLARSATAHRDLNIQFETRQVTKIYHALVIGNPPWETQTIKQPLRANGDRRHRTVADTQRGKPSSTEFRTLERFCDHTLLEAIPRTGRTHQIRAHLALAGFPILADPLYKYIPVREDAHQEPLSNLMLRLGLHALSLCLTHPLTHTPISLSAPYADDFATALERLRSEQGSVRLL